MLWNPDALACGVAAIGFIILAILIVALPSFSVSRHAHQGIALLIGSTGLAINAILQSTVFNTIANDPPRRRPTMVIDLDRIERLA